MVTLKRVREAVPADTYSVRDGVFTVRRGFFYGGLSGNKLADAVLAAFPGAEIVAHDTLHMPFRGGAGVARNSHFLVRFRVREGA